VEQNLCERGLLTGVNPVIGMVIKSLCYFALGAFHLMAHIVADPLMVCILHYSLYFINISLSIQISNVWEQAEKQRRYSLFA